MFGARGRHWARRKGQTMAKFTEVVQAIQHVMHVSKPLVFEAVLFIWALVEMGRFIMNVVTGEAGA